MTFFIIDKGVHRPLPTSNEQRIILVGVDLIKAGGVLDHGSVARRNQKAKAYNIVLGILAFVAGIAPAIKLDLAPVGRGDCDLIALFGEFVVGMNKFCRP
jgi:hypothetical protein